MQYSIKEVFAPKLFDTLRRYSRAQFGLSGLMMANVVVPFFGGIPATGAIARTMTNINNGGRTPVAGIIHAVVLLLVLLFMGQLVGMIPMSCLAAVLIMVAYSMSGWKTIRGLIKHPNRDL